MNQSKKSMRRRYFIKNGMQLRYLRTNILLTILASLFIVITVYQLTINILGTSLAEVYPPALLNGIYNTLESTLRVRLLWIIIPLILVIITATILISHRLAGPAYRIERDLSEMAEGNFTKKIRLKKYDELKPIAANLNKMIDMISQNLNSIEKNLENISKLYQKLSHGGSDLSKYRDISKEIDTSLKGAKDALSYFKIK